MTISERYRYYSETVKSSFRNPSPGLKWQLLSIATGHSAQGLSMLPRSLLKSGNYFAVSHYKRKMFARNYLLHLALFNKVSQKLWLDRVMPEVSPPILCYVAGKRIIPLDTETEGECPQDLGELLRLHDTLFLKPGDRTRGAGAYLLEWRDGGSVVNGRPLSRDGWDGIAAGLDTGYTISRKIVQGRWSAQFHPQTVNTMRILTGTSLRTHAVCLISATLRIGTSETIPTDNYKIGRGGWATGIDLDTGRLGPAVRFDPAARIRIESDTHPETGAQIAGATVPDWPSVRQTAVTLAGLLPRAGIAGWDVALTDNGVVIVELNTYPSIDLHQTTTAIADTEEKRSMWREMGMIHG